MTLTGDLARLNSELMAIAVIILMVVIFVTLRAIGLRWIAIGIDALLLSILLRRIDEIVYAYFGYDLFSPTFTMLLPWFSIAVLFVAFVRVWQRRYEIKQIEALHAKQAKLLKDLDDKIQMSINWIDDPAYTAQSRALNDQIDQALRRELDRMKT